MRRGRSARRPGERALRSAMARSALSAIQPRMRRLRRETDACRRCCTRSSRVPLPGAAGARPDASARPCSPPHRGRSPSTPLGPRSRKREARIAAEQPLVPVALRLDRRARILDGAHARARQQREGDDGNFPQIELLDLADARARLDAPLHGLEADREPVDRARLHQRQHFAAALHIGNEPAARIKPARIFHSSCHIPIGSAGSC